MSHRRSPVGPTRAAETDLSSRGRALLQGVGRALRLPAFAVMASMVGLGSPARESGLTLGVAITSSASIWGLPGQVAMAELYALGVPTLAIVLAVSGANARFLPMTLALMPQFREHRRAWRWRYVLVQLIPVGVAPCPSDLEGRGQQEPLLQGQCMDHDEKGR